MKWQNTNITQPRGPQDELQALVCAHSTEVRIPARQVFSKPGENLNGVYYISSGRTRHFMVGEDGIEKTLYILSEGWFFGETPCSLATPTSLYSETEVDSILHHISFEDYERLLAENKVFRDAILVNCSKKTLILRHEIENLTFNSLKDRLKRIYCSAADTEHLIDGAWYNLKLNCTQYELSTIVGGARVTVSKLIGELCQEGFIRVLNRKTQISAAALQRIKSGAED